MKDLFTQDGRPVDGPSTATAEPAYRLLPTPKLPATAAGYGGRRREPADPVELRGLPRTRGELDRLLRSLCDRLIAALGDGLRGTELVVELELTGTRALRLLVAYGHVHHRLRQIVGVPGDGYVWGDCRPQIYAEMTGHARRMGRCWLFNATLYGRKPALVEAAQLVFDWVGGVPGEGREPRRDELAALMATEGVGVEQLLGTLVSRLSKTDEGRQVLGRIGERHASVLLPAEAFDRLRGQIRAASDGLDALAGGNVCPGTAPAARPRPMRNSCETGAHKSR